MTNSWSQINSDSAHLGLSLLAGMRWKELHAEARCKEKSPIIEGIVSEAKKSNDLVKFGMVLHAYADTFSHAGFSGLLSKINSIEELQATLSTPLIPSHLLKKWVLRIRTSKTGETMDRLLHSIVPSYGHGQALTYPDLPHLKWSYHYDYSDNFSSDFKLSDIDNHTRFRDTFTAIQAHFTDYLDKHPEYKDPTAGRADVTPLFNTLVAEVRRDKKRIKNWPRKTRCRSQGNTHPTKCLRRVAF